MPIPDIAEINEIIERLKMHVEHTPKDVGIALGSDLFAECVKREMITLEVFVMMGTKLFQQRLPALKKSIFVFDQPFMDPWNFEIGPNNDA